MRVLPRPLATPAPLGDGHSEECNILGEGGGTLMNLHFTQYMWKEHAFMFGSEMPETILIQAAVKRKDTAFSPPDI